MTTPDTPDALAARLAHLRLRERSSIGSKFLERDAIALAETAIAALRSATEKPNTVRADPAPSVGGGDSHRAAVAWQKIYDWRRKLALVDVTERGHMCEAKSACQSVRDSIDAELDRKEMADLAPTLLTVTEQPRAATETAAAVDGGAQPVARVHDFGQDGDSVEWLVDYPPPQGTLLYAVPQQGQPQEPVTPVVAPGWKLVPVEPTDAMRMAFTAKSEHCKPDGSDYQFHECYRAMLAASPLPETPPPTEEKR